jgi:hypothetical protein
MVPQQGDPATYLVRRERESIVGEPSVVRYIGYVLVGLMALALASGAAVIIFGNLSERLTDPGNVRLVVFDDVVADGGAVSVRSYLQSLDDGRPICGTWLVIRTPDGRSVPVDSYTDGQTPAWLQAGLAPGRHKLEVGYPATAPRLDVMAEGTAWVLLRNERVVWIDARAVIRPPEIAGSTVRVRPEDMSAAGDVIKTVAQGRVPVYLVLAKAEAYGSIRRGLRESGLPEGPVCWLRPGAEENNLSAIAKASMVPDAVLAASGEVESAARRVTASVIRVPAAGQESAPANGAKIVEWSKVVEMLSSLGRTGSAGGVK